MTFRSIRIRLFTTQFLVIAVLCCVGIVIIDRQYRSTESQRLSQWFNSVSVNASNIAPFLFMQERVANRAQLGLQSMAELEGIKALFVFDENWALRKEHINPVYREDMQKYMFRVTDISIRQSHMSFKQGDIYLVTKLDGFRARDGYLLLVGDYQGQLEKRLTDLTLQTVPQITGVAIVLLLLGGFLGRRLLGSLVEVRRCAQDVLKRYGSQSHTSKLSFGNDDLGDITEAFGVLTNRLNKAVEQQQSVQQQITLLEAQRAETLSQDQITHLPNRHLFTAQLDTALLDAKQHNKDLGLFLLDVNHFVDVNQRHGFDFGDRVLQEIAKELASIVTGQVKMTRLVADKFLFFMPAQGSTMSFTIIAQTLLQRLNRVYEVDNFQVALKLSVGAAFAREANYDRKTLMNHAEIALAQNKTTGDAGYAFYDAALMEQARRQKQIRAGFMTALRQNDLVILYAPRVNHQGELLGFELMPKWQHPTLGEILPSEFLPVIAGTALSRDYTEWMVRSVLSQGERIQSMLNCHLVFSINLFMDDLRSNGLYELLQLLFLDSKLSTSNIEFDIPELAFVDDIDSVIERIQQLRELGFKVALDNFGSVHSSIHYLVACKADTVKLSRELMAGIEHDSESLVAVGAIIEMANNLNIEVTVQGVDNTKQFKAVSEFGCHYMQGDLFGRAIPMEKLPSFLSLLPVYSKSHRASA